MQIFRLIGVILSIGSINVYSFGVDVCFNSTDQSQLIVNCINVGEECRTSHLSIEQNLSCRIAATSDSMSGLSGGNHIIGGRSLVHSDSLYLMAQLIGYSPWQAYQMMIYTEATDQSEYTPFSQQGERLLTEDEIASCRENWGITMPNQCLLITPYVSGLGKFNFNTGGMLLHLHARYSPDGLPPPSIAFPTDYFSDENRPYELLLTTLQNWIFDRRPNNCVSGIVQSPFPPDAPVAACEDSEKLLKYPLNFFALGFSITAVPFSSYLGTLVIEEDSENPVIATDKSLEKYIFPQTAKFAKMGIFLHALGDRYSHHMCTDKSYFSKKPDGNYGTRFATEPCAQGNHFLWHVWEQGTLQTDDNLGVEYQTMKPSLDAMYDQLVSYAGHLGIPVNTKLDKSQLLTNLINVLQVYDAQTRLNNMVQLMEDYDVLPLPGHGTDAPSIEEWLTLAGAPVH